MAASGRWGGTSRDYYESAENGRSISALVLDRKSTRLNSSHSQISYAVFCLKKKNTSDTVSGGARSADRSPSVLTSGPSSRAFATLFGARYLAWTCALDSIHQC